MLGELFDPTAEVLVHERLRPHWSQAGAMVFVTFRSRDSIPKSVLDRWEREKKDWMHRRGHSSDRHWSEILPELSPAERNEFRRHFNRCREDCLDNCLDRCLLRHPGLAQIVAKSLLYFDGDRYRMGDFVVMPNHVHLLAAFPTEDAMKKQFDSWLHYTAFQINRQTGDSGRFWQQEPFDHLVRSVDQYEYLRAYIAENPAKAGLSAGEFLYRRYEG